MTLMCGRPVGEIGFGMISIVQAGAANQEASFETLDAALAHGINFWNAGEHYGTTEFGSLTIVRDYLRARPGAADGIILCVKGGIDPKTAAPMGSASALRESVKRIQTVLDGTKAIDVFEPGRIDKSVTLEETFGTLRDLISEGEIGAVGLGEISAETIRKVHVSKIVPIAMAEIEMSLFTTDPLTNGITKACAEMNIPIIAYSPLGRGMLTGTIRTAEDRDKRPHAKWPRFQGEAFDQNMKLVNAILEFAEQKQAQPAQVAISWLLALSKQKGMPSIIPIPGTSSVKRLEENCRRVDLSSDDMEQLGDILARYEVVGARYPEAHMAYLDA